MRTILGPNLRYQAQTDPKVQYIRPEVSISGTFRGTLKNNWYRPQKYHTVFTTIVSDSEPYIIDDFYVLNERPVDPFDAYASEYPSYDYDYPQADLNDDLHSRRGFKILVTGFSLQSIPQKSYNICILQGFLGFEFLAKIVETFFVAFDFSSSNRKLLIFGFPVNRKLPNFWIPSNRKLSKVSYQTEYPGQKYDKIPVLILIPMILMAIRITGVVYYAVKENDKSIKN